MEIQNVVMATHNVLRFSFDADATSGLRDFPLNPTVASASPHSTQSSRGTLLSSSISNLYYLLNKSIN